jgi:transposase-like protein
LGFKEKCKLCNREFTNQNEYNEHQYLHPFTKQCEKCNGTMEQISHSFTENRNKKHRIDQNESYKHDEFRGSRYVCLKCGYTELYANWE